MARTALEPGPQHETISSSFTLNHGFTGWRSWTCTARVIVRNLGAKLDGAVIGLNARGASIKGLG